MQVIRRSAVAVIVVAALLLSWASVAGAQVAPNGDVSPDAPSSATLTINNLLVQIILGALLPVGIAFFQRPTNPGWVKVIVAGALTALAVGISEQVQEDGSALLTQEWFIDYLLTLGASILAYLGIWNPLTESRGGINTAIDVSLVPQIGSGPA